MAARELEPRGPKKVWVVLVIPALELEHERIASHEPIVDQAVGVVGIAGLGHAEESLVPGAAGLHVAHRLIVKGKAGLASFLKELCYRVDRHVSNAADRPH